MKFLITLFLAGFGLAAASSVLSQSFEVDVQLQNEPEVFYNVVYRAAGNDEAKSLRERLEGLMEIVKEHRDYDKHPPKEILLEMKQIFEDMEKKDIELTPVEQMVKWAVDFYLQRHDSVHDILAHEDPKTELGRILKKHFEEILEKVRDIIENGKTYKEDLGEKLKEIAQKLKDMKVDIGDHAKDLLKKLKDKAKDYWKKIIDKITPGSEPFAADNNEETSLRKRLEELMKILNEHRYDDELSKLETILDLKKTFDEMEKKGIKLTTLEQMFKEDMDHILRELDSTHDFLAHEDPQTELGRILKKHFEEILEKVKDIIENGKTYKEDLGEKLKEIAQKLKDMKVDIGDHAKDLLKKLKDKAKDYWKKIIDKITPGSEPFAAEKSVANVYRIAFQEILEEVRGIIERGKTYKGDPGEKLIQIARQMKEMKIDIDEYSVYVLRILQDKAKGYWKNVIDEVLRESEPLAAEEDDVARNLRERFEEILEKIKDAIENRKTLGGNVVAKLKDIYQEMRKKSIPFGDKVKELLEQMKEKATGIWKRILDNININKRSVVARGTGAENLRERLEELLEKLRESFRDRKLPGKGFIAKLRQIRDEMREKKVPLGGKLKEMIEKLKENANGVWRRILDRIGQHAPRAEEDEYANSLRKRLNEILDLVEDGFVTRTTIGGQWLYHLETVWDELKEKNIPPGDRAIQLIQKLKKMTNGEWKALLFKILPDEE